MLADLNAFLSTADRTMLHDASWHFLSIGIYLERAGMTCSALRHVLSERALIARDGAERGVTSQSRDNPELSALLRMLGSQDAYRRVFQSAQPTSPCGGFFPATDHGAAEHLL